MKQTPLIITDAENARVGHPLMKTLTETLARQISQAIKSEDALKDGFRVSLEIEPLNGIVIKP